MSEVGPSSSVYAAIVRMRAPFGSRPRMTLGLLEDGVWVDFLRFFNSKVILERREDLGKRREGPASTGKTSASAGNGDSNAASRVIPVPILPLSDVDDLPEYSRLTDVKLRRKLEPERGLYLAESLNVIRRAVEAGHEPISFLT